MEEAHAAFKESDRNNSGYIDCVELRGALGRILNERQLSSPEAVEVLKAYDDKPDGRLDFHEFTKLLHDSDDGFWAAAALSRAKEADSIQAENAARLRDGSKIRAARGS